MLKKVDYTSKTNSLIEKEIRIVVTRGGVGEGELGEDGQVRPQHLFIL